MPDSMERVDVVATVIYCGERLLMVFNEKWGSFTIPVTKLRAGQLGVPERLNRWELGSEAAMRNVAECLGITSVQPPRLLMDLGDLRQSDRSHEVKHYAFQIYGFPVDERQIQPVVLSTWLTADEILDPDRQPISPTAQALVVGLREAALNRRTEFPPPQRPKRTAVSSIAVIARGEGSKKTWLCQWNEHWERYFLVGGHQDEGESPGACMVRELKEELKLDAGDYTCQPRQLLEYEDWSTSRWQTTDYKHSMFDVQLHPAAEKKLGGNPARLDDPANRWLTAAEILSERCHDDKLISPTARTTLTRLGEL